MASINGDAEWGGTIVRTNGDEKPSRKKNGLKQAKKIYTQIYGEKHNVRKKGQRRSGDEELAMKILGLRYGAKKTKAKERQKRDQKEWR